MFWFISYTLHYFSVFFCFTESVVIRKTMDMTRSEIKMTEMNVYTYTRQMLQKRRNEGIK